MAGQELTYQKLIDFFSESEDKWIKKDYGCLKCEYYKYRTFGKDEIDDGNGNKCFIKGQFMRGHVVNRLNRNIMEQYIKIKKEKIYDMVVKNKEKYNNSPEGSDKCNVFDDDCFYCKYDPKDDEIYKTFMNVEPRESTDFYDLFINIPDYDLKLWICITLGLIKISKNMKWEDEKRKYFRKGYNFWNEKRKEDYKNGDLWKNIH